MRIATMMSCSSIKFWRKEASGRRTSVCTVIVIALATWCGATNAKIVSEKMRPGQVFAACHYIDTGHMQNDVLTLFSDTKEVWFGGAWGSRKSGRIIFSNERIMAAEIIISSSGTLLYFASVLINLESGKYLKSEIHSNCSASDGCEYEAVAFEGKCHQILGELYR